MAQDEFDSRIGSQFGNSFNFSRAIALLPQVHVKERVFAEHGQQCIRKLQRFLFIVELVIALQAEFYAIIL